MNHRGLREVLNDEDYWSRRFTLRDAYKDRNVDVLVAGLTDPDHRIIAALYLGKLRAADSRIPLERLLRASDRGVRASAAKALGLIGSAEVVPALLGAVNDSEQNVRTTAVAALGESRCDEAVSPLIEIAGSGEGALVPLALASLRRLNRRAAVPDLIKISHQVTVMRRVPYWRTIAVLRLRGD